MSGKDIRSWFVVGLDRVAVASLRTSRARFGKKIFRRKSGSQVRKRNTAARFRREPIRLATRGSAHQVRTKPPFHDPLRGVQDFVNPAQPHTDHLVNTSPSQFASAYRLPSRPTSGKNLGGAVVCVCFVPSKDVAFPCEYGNRQRPTHGTPLDTTLKGNSFDNRITESLHLHLSHSLPLRLPTAILISPLLLSVATAVEETQRPLSLSNLLIPPCAYIRH